LTTSIQFPINSTSKTTDHLPGSKEDLSAKTTSIILISSTTSFNKSLIQKALTPATSKLLNNTKITTKLTTVSDLLTTTTTINNPISSDDSTTTKKSLISNIANITTNQIGELTTSIQFPINSTSKTTDHLPRSKEDLPSKTTSIIHITTLTASINSINATDRNISVVQKYSLPTNTLVEQPIYIRQVIMIFSCLSVIVFILIVYLYPGSFLLCKKIF
jgi:hypothetical protein